MESTKKSKPISSETRFQSYVLIEICKDGGTRMQLTVSDLVNKMQKLDPKDDINLTRKQYGNLDKCLKSFKSPVYLIDAMVIKLLPPDEIATRYESGIITKEAYDLYLETLEINKKKNEETEKIMARYRGEAVNFTDFHELTNQLMNSDTLSAGSTS